ncbi:protein of unknown function [Paraburkholderia dioscoreae]|uniref:Uncharacterized protein n=1 Tax=Paraburkholderia dioscoreae TaxID=2604047 RepID=A0A5Q4Z7I4_9BURK|nr:protein of unknown function [Paraburkholderia dioscoreae]
MDNYEVAAFHCPKVAQPHRKWFHGPKRGASALAMHGPCSPRYKQAQRI